MNFFVLDFHFFFIAQVDIRQDVEFRQNTPDFVSVSNPKPFIDAYSFFTASVPKPFFYS